MGKIKWSHFENSDKTKKSQTASFEGYEIRDKVLEDVMINITVESDGSLSASFKDEDLDYVSDFNVKKLLKEAIKYAKEMGESESEFYEKDYSGGSSDEWYLIKCPLHPNRTGFYLRDNSNGEYYGAPIQLFLVDMDNEDNDDIRELGHPDFEKYFENVCENSFEIKTVDPHPIKNSFKSIEEARSWLLSIGMTELDEDPMVGG